MTRPSEKEFEAHFCEQLEAPFQASKMTYSKRETNNVDLNALIDDELLTKFLERTQKDELKELKIDLGNDWLPALKEKISKQLTTRKIFEIIRDGVEVHGRHLNLIYFKPETTHNPEQMENYESNIFSYVRQFAFRNTRESIDLVLFVNGIAIITIELKNEFNGQNVEDAVHQYIERDKSEIIFQYPFLHLASDTRKAKIATQFIENSAEDFVHFNTDIENPIKQKEFDIDYLYHDVLRPESLLEIIEAYLFCFEDKDKSGKKFRKFLFPRYHQRRTVKKLVVNLSEQFGRSHKLGNKYLIQHSPGSGKSYTIAVMQRFLRNLHVKNEHIFDSIIVVTDRINLDGQIKGTIGSSENQEGIIAHAESTAELADALNEDTKVVITTIQKFSVKNLDELLKIQRGKNICFIIDEAHRSQAGKLHKHMVEKFGEVDPQEELLEGIGKMSYTNAAFIALTATPSDKTIEMFGKPFDVYSMDQAEQEGYILNVVENVVTYSTLFKLSKEVRSREEYPPLVVAKKIRSRAFEDETVIGEKIDIILKVFEAQSKFKIGGKAKVMIVTSSRKAAVKYKILLDKAIKFRGLPYKALVAFSGSVKLSDSKVRIVSYTENNLNNIEEEIEDEFNKPEYRFIVVANKFQYGFNQPYLHTMFLDKSVSGINAVQTISRLNRVLVGKTDTLVVDFTNSYENIIAAFRKFKGAVNDYSAIDVRNLPLLKMEILSKNLFTTQDVSDFKAAIMEVESATSTSVVMNRVVKNIEKLDITEIREFRGLINKFNGTFKYLDNLVKISDMGLRDFALFTNYLAKYIDPLGKGGKLDEELRLIQVISHKIRLEKKIPKPESTKVAQLKAKRSIDYVTVEEVIEAINANYDLALSDNEKDILREYVAEIVKDPEILEAIKANKNKDLERLYKTTLASKLKERALQFFLTNNPARLMQYIKQDLLAYLNQEAFRLATIQH